MNRREFLNTISAATAGAAASRTLVASGLIRRNIYGPLINKPADDTNHVMDGIVGSKDTLGKLFACAGDRVYMIGAQNGGFPDIGPEDWYVPNEMGGIWNHPIKLMDGFWVKIKDTSSKSSAWLEKAHTFINLPYANKHLYSIPEMDIEVERFQFCPDGLEGFVVEYTLTNTTDVTRRMVLTFLGRSDLSPVWLSEEIGIKDGEDRAQWDNKSEVIIATDKNNPWYVVFGSSQSAKGHKIGKDLFGPEKTASERGISAAIEYDVAIGAHGTTKILFFIAGSYKRKNEALNTYRQLVEGYDRLLQSKQERYRKMLNVANIKIPDKKLQEACTWLKFHTDWLVRDVPEVGRGLGAILPTYPWWFGIDNSHALLGVIALGEFTLAKDTLRIIQTASEKANGNGRIIHEISTNGVVTEPSRGDTQETPDFIICLWRVFQWTGDIEFLRDMYPTVKKGLNWLLTEQDEDADLLPKGMGNIEHDGMDLEMIDSAVYTHGALVAAAKMAELFGEHERAREYVRIAARLKKKINEQLWLEEEGLYAEMVGTPEEVFMALGRIINEAKQRHYRDETIFGLEKLRKKAGQMDTQKDLPWLILKSGVINTPMEAGLAPRDKAIRALDRVRTEEFAGIEDTGRLAVAECSYGRTDEAISYVLLNANTITSSSYCIVESFYIHGIVWPLISHVFGIKPDAYNKRILIQPRLPKGWEDIRIERLPVGDTEIKMERKGGKDVSIYIIETRDIGWNVTLNLLKTEGAEYFVNNRKTEAIRKGDTEIELGLTEMQNEIRIQYDQR